MIALEHCSLRMRVQIRISLPFNLLIQKAVSYVCLHLSTGAFSEGFYHLNLEVYEQTLSLLVLVICSALPRLILIKYVVTNALVKDYKHNNNVVRGGGVFVFVTEPLFRVRVALLASASQEILCT